MNQEFTNVEPISTTARRMPLKAIMTVPLQISRKPSTILQEAICFMSRGNWKKQFRSTLKQSHTIPL